MALAAAARAAGRGRAAGLLHRALSGAWCVPVLLPLRRVQRLALGACAATRVLRVRRRNAVRCARALTQLSASVAPRSCAVPAPAATLRAPHRRAARAGFCAAAAGADGAAAPAAKDKGGAKKGGGGGGDKPKPAGKAVEAAVTPKSVDFSRCVAPQPPTPQPGPASAAARAFIRRSPKRSLAFAP